MSHFKAKVHPIRFLVSVCLFLSFRWSLTLYGSYYRALNTEYAHYLVFRPSVLKCDQIKVGCLCLVV